MLLNFLLKRTAVLGAAVVAGSFFWPGHIPLLQAGILLGWACALYRMRLSQRFLLATINTARSTVKNTLLQLLSQFLAFGLLLALAFVNMKLFAGFATGLLLIPAYICFNALTEKLGLSHNNWGDGPASP